MITSGLAPSTLAFATGMYYITTWHSIFITDYLHQDSIVLVLWTSFSQIKGHLHLTRHVH